jgi:hypothetical protein
MESLLHPIGNAIRDFLLSWHFTRVGYVGTGHNATQHGGTKNKNLKQTRKLLLLQVSYDLLLFCFIYLVKMSTFFCIQFDVRFVSKLMSTFARCVCVVVSRLTTTAKQVVIIWMKRTNDKIEVADTIDRVWLEKLVRIFVQLSFFFSIGLANTQFCRGIDSFALLCQLKCIPVTQSHHPIKC